MIPIALLEKTMKRIAPTSIPLVIAILTLAVASPAHGQGVGRWLRERAEQKVKERAEARADRARDRAFDATEAAVVCAVTDRKCVDEAEKAGKQVVLTDEQGNVVGHSAAEAAEPGMGVWANYDFVPGERVLFAEDFAGDVVGDFPRRLEYVGGLMEVVERNGERFLRASAEGRFAIQLPETLPSRFTIEFDVTVPGQWESILFFSGEGVDGLDGAPTGACCYVPTAAVFFTPVEVGLRRNGHTIAASRRIADVVGALEPAGRLMRIRLHVDGRYANLYVNETRVANVPNLEIPRTDRLYIDLNGHPEHPILIGNMSVNAGGRPLYDALVRDGRVATQGILFDTGSDRLRPESTPTLAEIGEMLRSHPDLRLRIEGHTDSVGNASFNQTLSERRAAAVKAFLETRYGIEGDRLEAVGYGDTRPAASNETPEGRQMNRRVELVKL